MIGEEIQAIGFGRFDYSLYKLAFVELILPTITMGIVSKKMYSDSVPIIFKTDASLHHGFSGCGIWSKQKQKGVAVFIVKNTTNSNELTRHNFNYLTSYIYKRILKESNENA